MRCMRGFIRWDSAPGMPVRRTPRDIWKQRREPYGRRGRIDSSSSSTPDYAIDMEEDERDMDSMAVAVDPGEEKCELESPENAMDLEEDLGSPGLEEKNLVADAIDVSPEVFHDAEYYIEALEGGDYDENEYEDDDSVSNNETAEAKSVESVEKMPEEEQLVHSIEPVEAESKEHDQAEVDCKEAAESTKEVSEKFKQVIDEAKRKFMVGRPVSRRDLVDLRGNVNGQYYIRYSNIVSILYITNGYFVCQSHLGLWPLLQSIFFANPPTSVFGLCLISILQSAPVTSLTSPGHAS